MQYLFSYEIQKNNQELPTWQKFQIEYKRKITLAVLKFFYHHLRAISLKWLHCPRTIVPLPTGSVADVYLSGTAGGQEQSVLAQPWYLSAIQPTPWIWFTTVALILALYILFQNNNTYLFTISWKTFDR